MISEKTRRLLQENHRDISGKNNPNYGGISERHKRRIGIGNLGKRRNKKQKRRYAIAAKKVWKDPRYARKVIREVALANRTKFPNNKEKFLRSLFDFFVPGEFKYTGNGDVIIGGKNPDFVNVNGKKQVAELFGNHWHEKGDGRRKIRHYRKYGIDCLIVWEKELRHPEKLGWKILEFVNK